MCRAYTRVACSALLITGLAAACGPEPEKLIDLIRETPTAEKRWKGILVEFGCPSARPFLGDGWSYEETAPDGNVFRWALGEKASFRFESDAPGRRLAWIECAPFSFPGSSTQVLEVEINGERVAALELREGRHRYPLDVRLAEGVNAVELGFAYAGRPQGREQENEDRRPLAVAFYRFDVPPEGTPLLSGRPGPFSLVEPAEGPQGVYLPRGGTLSYYLVIPDKARLMVQAGAARPEFLLASAGSNLEVVVAGEDGKTLEATRRTDRARGEVLSLDMSLEELETLRAKISFRAVGQDLFVAPRLFTRERRQVQPDHFKPQEDLNVLMIVLDGASARRVGSYGFPKTTSPKIDELARVSVVFDNAITQAVYTIASIGSLLTSQYPERHQSVSFADRLPPTAVTLPGVLSHGGVATAGFSGNAVVSPAFGLERGYDEFYDVRRLEGYTGRGDSVRRRFCRWLDENKGRRFFAYVHFREPHFPWNPPSPFDTAFGPDAPFPEGIADWQVVEAYNRAAGRGEDVAVDLIERIRALYDGNMAYVDAQVGQILERLEERGLDDETVVILTADHGEALFEHRYFGHNTQLYEESIRVPLIVRVPGLGSRRVKQVVELLDIAPTVVDLMEVGGRRADMQGRSLVPLLHGETLPERFAYSRTLWNKPRYAVRDSRYKLIWDSRTDAMELYDLTTDPGEEVNLVEGRSFLTGFFRQQLHQWLHEQGRLRVGAPTPESSFIPEDLRRDLESLGYIEHLEKDQKK